MGTILPAVMKPQKPRTINGVYLDHSHDHDILVPLVPKVWNERTKLLLFKVKSYETLAYRDANLAFICAW